MKKFILVLTLAVFAFSSCQKDRSELSQQSKNTNLQSSKPNVIKPMTLDDGATGIPAKLPNGTYRFAKDGVTITLSGVILENEYYYGDPVSSYNLEVENGSGVIQAINGYFVANYNKLGTAAAANIVEQVHKYNKDWRDYIDTVKDSVTKQLKQPLMPWFSDYIKNVPGGTTGTVKGIIIRNPNSVSTLSVAGPDFKLNTNTAFGPYLGEALMNGVNYMFYGRSGAVKRVTHVLNGQEVAVRFDNGAYTSIGQNQSNVTGILYTATGTVNVNQNITSIIQPQ